MTKRPLIILTGPTAVGKTKLSIALAKKINGEIISADSMQVYKGMDIGTAKIMPEEMQGVPHYLIDEFDPDNDFNVVKFKEYANQYMDQIYDKNKIPILVGGTGFYIQAVLYDIDFTENENDTEYRTMLEQEAIEKGPEYLHQQLATIDPESAIVIHANNTKRVIRALEYYKQTGSKISSHNEKERQKSSPYDFTYFVLNQTRDYLYQQIDRRVDQMEKDGLLEEVNSLRAKGYQRNMVSMQGIGYKEIFSYLENECSLEEAMDQIKKDTRHFAKRQITWFKREKDVIWLPKNEFADEDAILEHMVRICSQKTIIKEVTK